MSVVEGLLEVFWSNRRIWTARRAKTVPFTALSAGADFSIEGRVEACEPLLCAPFTLSQCVGWLARLEQKDSLQDINQGPEPRWIEEFRDQSSTSFWLSDDSGEPVWIDLRAKEASWFAFEAPQVSQDHPHLNDENPQLCEYLRAHGVLPTQYMGIAGDTRFFEKRVQEGDFVCVFGTVEESNEVQAKGYRDRPHRYLRMRGSKERPLVVFPPRVD